MSIEIIDVDLLDDDVGQHPTVSRDSSLQQQSQPPREVIFLDDSDDEVQVVAVRPSPRVPRERLFSPPPPVQPPVSNVPPVPRIPPQFMANAMRAQRRSRMLGGPPVVPLDREFLVRHPQRSPTPVAGPSNANRDSGPRAAPRHHVWAAAHHVPILGLGGAFIANHRANVLRTIHPRDLYDELDAFPGLADFLDEGPHFRLPNRYQSPLREKEHYQPSYTHPEPVQSGFTHDFARSSSPDQETPNFPPSSSSNPIVIKDDSERKDPSKAEPSTTLVCARCLDPLVLNSGLKPADAILRRIWSLRCGHLIDGKCLHEIGQPQVVVDRKGKGKAKAEPAAFIPYGEGPSSSLLQDETNILREGPAPTDSNPIRSRLRSQNHSTPSSTVAASATSPTPGSAIPYGSHAPAPPTSPLNSRKRKRGGLSKAAANKRAKVEEEFEWECPVASCKRKHMSIKINGVWGPEKERQIPKKNLTVPLHDIKGPRGAIPVFA